MTSDIDMSLKAGWNPYEPFYPKDDFSKQLLLSIPSKVSKWLELLNQDTTGEYGELAWNYTPEGGTIIFANESNERFVQIWWDYQDGVVTICGSDERFEDISSHLEFFTAVEFSIYDELESLHHAINDKTIYVPTHVRADEAKSAFDLDLEAARRNAKSS